MWLLILKCSMLLRLFTLSGSMFSIKRSSVGIQLGANWQFWKKTHFPRSIALCIRASALGPCPWPNDIAFNFLENRISSANLYNADAGSVPGESTKIKGVVGDESLKTCDKSAVWGSINRWPKFTATKSCIALVTLSALIHRKTSNFWNPSKSVCQCPGSSSLNKKSAGHLKYIFELFLIKIKYFSWWKRTVLPYQKSKTHTYHSSTHPLGGSTFPKLMEKRRLRQIGGGRGGGLPYYVEVFWSFLMMQHRKKILMCLSFLY